MTISNAVREQVRQRADFACEYCGVTETDSGGNLTIDHFQPQSQGGSDNLENLIYCCHRCNEYKSDYWPQSSVAPSLWNPRVETSDTHFVEALDSVLYASTEVGRFTILRLRLNRSALVAHRLQKQERRGQDTLLMQYKELNRIQEQMRQQEALFIKEQRLILERQRTMIEALLDLD